MTEAFCGQILDGERTVLANVEGKCVVIEPTADKLIVGPNEPLGGRFVPGRLGEWMGECIIVCHQSLWLNIDGAGLINRAKLLKFDDGREGPIFVTAVDVDMGSPPRVAFVGSGCKKGDKRWDSGRND